MFNQLKSCSIDQWVNWIGTAGLFVFAFGVFYKISLAQKGLLLMLLAFGFTIRSLKKTILLDKLLVVSIVFLVFLSIQYFHVAKGTEEVQFHIRHVTFELIQTGFFTVFLLAFWLNRAAEKWDLAIILLMAGFLIRILRNIEWEHFPELAYRLWTGAERATFISSSPNYFGEWCAVILLACILLQKRIRGVSNKNYTVRGMRLAFWVVMTAVSSMGLYFSQSRGALLAFTSVISATGVYWFLKKKDRRWLKIFLLAGLVIIAVSVIRLPQTVEKRFFPKGKFYLAIIQGRYDLQNKTGNDAIDSIAHRLMLWKLSWERLKERSWLGHGPGTSRYLIRDAGEEYASIKPYVDFHNQYLEFLVQLGIVGFTFYALCFFLILQQLFQGKNTSRIHQDYFMFIVTAFALLCITCLFGRSFFNYSPIYLIGFLGGMCYSSKFSDYELRNMQGQAGFWSTFENPPIKGEFQSSS